MKIKFKTKSHLTSLFIFLFAGVMVYAQQEEFSLLEQFNGRYDFTFVGNTMNYTENGLNYPCTIKTSSSASLFMQPNDSIEKVYLYWSGSGTGDLEIKLNDIDITPDRFYPLNYTTNSNINLDFFVAVTDVTQQVLSIGNGIYTVSEFDVSDYFVSPSGYCLTGTNYAGWVLVIVYKNENLPLNQLNIYEGLKYVPNELTITLDNLNVIDNQGAKIGFVAWEGDASIAVNETLKINGNIISNPPLNPANNAFNGTNSITNSAELYNMDLDVYGIHNNIQIGDTTAEISLTSGQDFVIISTVVTKLNSQLPDATIVIDDINTNCGWLDIEIFYTVYNINSTDILPAQTYISVYVNDVFYGVTQTINDIPIDGSESGSIIVSLPEFIENIDVYLIVDDNNGISFVTETNEDNNISNIVKEKLRSDLEFNFPENITSCNIGNRTAIFDFSQYDFSIKQNVLHDVSFHNSQEDALQKKNPIINTSAYKVVDEFPKEIFVRIDDGECFNITSFFLHIKNCPPTIYNGISVNNDGLNDRLIIDGLYDIFLDFEIFIYSRWGQLVYKGNHQMPAWDGKVNNRKTIGDEYVPTGTYFYILYLNDNDVPTIFTGYIYLTK